MNIKKFRIKKNNLLLACLFFLIFDCFAGGMEIKKQDNSFFKKKLPFIMAGVTVPLLMYLVAYYNKQDTAENALKNKETKVENIEKPQEAPVEVERLTTLEQIKLVLEEKNPRLAKNRKGTKEESILLTEEREYLIKLIRDLTPEYHKARDNHNRIYFYSKNMQSPQDEYDDLYNPLETLGSSSQKGTNGDIKEVLQYMYTLMKTEEYNVALNKYEMEKFIFEGFLQNLKFSKRILPIEKQNKINYINEFNKKIQTLDLKEKESVKGSYDIFLELNTILLINTINLMESFKEESEYKDYEKRIEERFGGMSLG